MVNISSILELKKNLNQIMFPTTIGFMSAKALRVKMLHEHLFSKVILETPSPRGPFKNAGIISIASILRELTMGLYLKIIGCTTINATLDAFMVNLVAKLKVI
jgi:hypothetical protein